jgi:(2R)-ethylmalonyl-CoA mutase
VISAKVEELKREALAELARIGEMGGAIKAVETGYIKERLVESNAARVAAIESGEQTVVGVNAYRESAEPGLAGGSSAVVTVDASAERDQIERLKAWRAARDAKAVNTALEALRAAAVEGRNIMEPSIACAKAGVTTGEWAGSLREAFGEFRAPTGVAATPRMSNDEAIGALRERAKVAATKLGRPPALLVAKPGLDGHSNGAEQIAYRARDCGFAVAYDGIRLTPAEIARAAKEKKPHVIGLSILSGSHKELVAEVMKELKGAGIADTPVIVGGIVPPEDEADLKAMGVSRIYTPKDFDLNAIMGDMLEIAVR